MDMLSRPINSAARQLRCASSPVMRVRVVTLATTVASHAIAVRADPGYAIRRPDVLTGGLVAGDSVKISITAPSTALIKRTTVLLNGRDVTRSLLPEGAAASMTGMASGLTMGANVFELVAAKGRDSSSVIQVFQTTFSGRMCL
jgi:hypothetical protein